MVDMGVGQDHRIDGPRVHWQLRPVAQPQLFEALKQAAIDQDLFGARTDQIFRAGNGAGSAEKLDLHGFLYTVPPCHSPIRAIRPLRQDAAGTQ